MKIFSSVYGTNNIVYACIVSVCVIFYTERLTYVRTRDIFRIPWDSLKWRSIDMPKDDNVYYKTGRLFRFLIQLAHCGYGWKVNMKYKCFCNIRVCTPSYKEVTDDKLSKSSIFRLLKN